MKIIVQGVPPWDGGYEFDGFRFKNEELSRIKEISRGIRGGELLEALGAGDADAWVAVTVVVAARHGVVIDPVDLRNADSDAIDFYIGDGDDADPPTQTPSGDGSSGNPSSSGGSSDSGSE